MENSKTERMAANDGEKKVVEESPAEKERGAEEVVSVELPAPPGWRKKVRFRFFPSLFGTSGSFFSSPALISCSCVFFCFRDEILARFVFCEVLALHARVSGLFFVCFLWFLDEDLF